MRTSGLRGYACARMHRTSILLSDSDGARESVGLQQPAGSRVGVDRGVLPAAGGCSLPPARWDGLS